MAVLTVIPSPRRRPAASILQIGPQIEGSLARGKRIFCICNLSPETIVSENKINYSLKTTDWLFPFTVTLMY